MGTSISCNLVYFEKMLFECKFVVLVPKVHENVAGSHENSHRINIDSIKILLRFAEILYVFLESMG